MRGVIFFQVCRAASAFDDAIHGLVGEARGLNASPADRSKERIFAFIREIGGLKPGPHSRNCTGFRFLARPDDNRSPLTFLIRLRTPERYPEYSVLEFKVAYVEVDDFRAAKAARESEQDNRLL